MKTVRSLCLSFLKDSQQIADGTTSRDGTPCGFITVFRAVMCFLFGRVEKHPRHQRIQRQPCAVCHRSYIKCTGENPNRKAVQVNRGENPP